MISVHKLYTLVYLIDIQAYFCNIVLKKRTMEKLAHTDSFLCVEKTKNTPKQVVCPVLQVYTMYAVYSP